MERNEMLALMEELEANQISAKKGQIIKGKVIHIGKEDVVIDIGGKTEGLIPFKELSAQPIKNPSEVVKKGDYIEALVLKEADEDGEVILSKKRADLMSGWKQIMQDKETNNILQFKVTSIVKGGVVADAYGLRGFIPATHLRHRGPLEDLIGQTLPLKVVDFDPSINKLILSHIQAVATLNAETKDKLLDTLVVGQVVKGKVTRVMDFGAFVDMGGLDALLPISEVSWRKVKHPNEVIHEDSEIEAQVYKIEGGRVTLSLKRLSPDPWTQIENKYNEGEVVSVKVSNIVDFGAFVELEPGIEALLPNTEISSKKYTAKEYFVVDQQLNVKIKSRKLDERKIVVSLKDISGENEVEPQGAAAESAGN